MRSVCYQKHRLIDRPEDRAESERKIAIPALGKRDRMPSRMGSPYDRTRTGNNRSETTKLLIPGPLHGSPDRHSRRCGYLPAMTTLARSGGDMRPQRDGGRRFQHGGGG
jgi:hypothetical protein